MTPILQRAQTTAERVRDMAVSQLAAEIDALTRERDEAQAEVERLRPAAEAWEAQQSFAKLYGDYLRGRVSEEDQRAADQKYQAAAARARAAKESQP